LSKSDDGKGWDDDKKTSEDGRFLLSLRNPSDVSTLNDGHQKSDEQKHFALIEKDKRV